MRMAGSAGDWALGPAWPPATSTAIPTTARPTCGALGILMGSPLSSNARADASEACPCVRSLDLADDIDIRSRPITRIDTMRSGAHHELLLGGGTRNGRPDGCRFPSRSHSPHSDHPTLFGADPAAPSSPPSRSWVGSPPRPSSPWGHPRIVLDRDPLGLVVPSTPPTYVWASPEVRTASLSDSFRLTHDTRAIGVRRPLRGICPPRRGHARQPG